MISMPASRHHLLRANGGLKAEFIRFDYDNEKAVETIARSELPDELPHRLLKAC
ncbi:hypothetical protein FHW88_005564 [Mucilaginibacter sp. SG538B]|nr:hypothetical protein [Mucilaginibacter sp. SG538B]